MFVFLQNHGTILDQQFGGSHRKYCGKIWEIIAWFWNIFSNVLRTIANCGMIFLGLEHYLAILDPFVERAWESHGNQRRKLLGYLETKRLWFLSEIQSFTMWILKNQNKSSWKRVSVFWREIHGDGKHMREDSLWANWVNLWIPKKMIFWK